MGRQPAKIIKKVCELCGVVYEVKDTKRERSRRFCSGYCAKSFNGKRNIGRTYSDEVNKSKGRRGKENAFYGKTHTEKTKKIISEKNTGNKRTEEFKKNLSKHMSGKNNPFYGKTHDANFRKKQSDRMKKNNPNNLEHVKKQRSDMMSGRGNPAWRGGSSRLYSDYGGMFTEELKTKIRQRDKFVCTICRKHGWIVHHIDYNKLNCNSENLITLCDKCHGKTNWERNKWYEYFTGKILNE